MDSSNGGVQGGRQTEGGRQKRRANDTTRGARNGRQPCESGAWRDGQMGVQ
jgi:hypothetical protein